ncbi:MAG: hypothetical protein ACRD11_12700 [Terriglobia bacterium]
MSTPYTTTKEMIPVEEYIREPVSLVSYLAHGWELHSAVHLTPAEERTMVREPAHAIPDSLAARIGKLRVFVVPYVGCFTAGDAICFSNPPGESHTAVWVETEERIHLVLACRQVDAHDTGFEFLASVAQLAVARMSPAEMQSYGRLLEGDLEGGVPGEIDREALDAKAEYLKQRGQPTGKDDPFERYRGVSLASTLAEYMHGLWHDVQIRVGPEHLPVAQLQQRMSTLAEVFPPNPGYDLFARELEGTKVSKT